MLGFPLLLDLLSEPSPPNQHNNLLDTSKRLHIIHAWGLPITPTQTYTNYQYWLSKLSTTSGVWYSLEANLETALSMFRSPVYKKYLNIFTNNSWLLLNIIGYMQNDVTS